MFYIIETTPEQFFQCVDTFEQASNVVANLILDYIEDNNYKTNDYFIEFKNDITNLLSKNEILQAIELYNDYTDECISIKTETYGFIPSDQDIRMKIEKANLSC